MFALPVTDRTPPVTKLAPVTLPVAVISAVPILPMLALPLTESDDSVPTLVILGCAADVTVPATPATATFKLATCVVLVTTIGAVPTAIVDIN